ncbi:MAG: SDR family NAD(P)-dependent oxidoreductase [Elusimicrobia bacterium]|nr:SDR family NAD(P)-dependent oxidoreductase [Elusimicrobiota bacterium]
MHSIKNKVVLVTGASSGIGWAAAKAFAAEGAMVALAARRVEKLRELEGLIVRAGGEALVLPCDISRPEESRAALEGTLKRWGRLDILVNNAGILSSVPFHEQSPEDIEAIMRTNYLGAAGLIRAALPHMLRQSSGHVVNVASVAGIVGFPYIAAYCASKFALVGLTEALRREYYGSGVAFTALCLGLVDTPMADQSLRDEAFGKWARPKTAEQVAAKILACCRSRAAEIIYADAPSWSYRLASVLPRLSDWIIHQGAKRLHPVGRRGNKTKKAEN